MSVTVTLDALEHDARLWGGVSDALASASSAASEVTLTTGALSWAAEVVGLVPVYEAARARVQQLLSEGAAETGVIASTLREVRAAYESSDTAQRDAYDGMWEPE